MSLYHQVNILFTTLYTHVLMWYIFLLNFDIPRHGASFNIDSSKIKKEVFLFILWTSDKPFWEPSVNRTSILMWYKLLFKMTETQWNKSLYIFLPEILHSFQTRRDISVKNKFENLSSQKVQNCISTLDKSWIHNFLWEMCCWINPQFQDRKLFVPWHCVFLESMLPFLMTRHLGEQTDQVSQVSEE